MFRESLRDLHSFFFLFHFCVRCKWAAWIQNQDLLIKWSFAAFVFVCSDMNISRHTINSWKKEMVSRIKIYFSVINVLFLTASIHSFHLTLVSTPSHTTCSAHSGWRQSESETNIFQAEYMYSPFVENTKKQKRNNNPDLGLPTMRKAYHVISKCLNRKLKP